MKVLALLWQIMGLKICFLYETILSKEFFRRISENKENQNMSPELMLLIFFSFDVQFNNLNMVQVDNVRSIALGVIWKINVLKYLTVSGRDKFQSLH